jgi:hypothetical protein
LDEKAVRKILARAVEIENQQRGALTEAQVRDIARDLSIPDHVIEQALAEHRTAGRQLEVPARRLPRWLGSAAIASLVLMAIMVFFFLMRVTPSPH